MKIEKSSTGRARDKPRIGGKAAVAALLLSFAVTGAVSGKPSYFGVRPFFVVSESMEPAIHKGQFVLAVPVEAGEIRPGDIAVYAVSFGGSAFFRKAMSQQTVDK